MHYDCKHYVSACRASLTREVIFNQVIAGFKPCTFSTRVRCLSHLSSPSHLKLGGDQGPLCATGVIVPQSGKPHVVIIEKGSVFNDHCPVEGLPRLPDGLVHMDDVELPLQVVLVS